MAYEHEPTRGPGVWVGAALLVAVGGGSMAWVSHTTPDGFIFAAIGWILVGVGVLTASVATWWARRRRR